MSMDQSIPPIVVSRLAWAFLSLPLCCANLRAQDAVRPSLAGQEAAEARHQSIENIPYNLLAGPVRFRFSITTGVEYNDNINLAQVNKESDVIIRPQFNINAIWPVTQLNTLRLDLGIGYWLLSGALEFNNNAILISPGSQLSFDIFVQDFQDQSA